MTTFAKLRSRPAIMIAAGLALVALIAGVLLVLATSNPAEATCPYPDYGVMEALANRDDPTWELPEACAEELRRDMRQSR